eukprot:362484-Prorocentrum_minimum.AAC.1
MTPPCTPSVDPPPCVLSADPPPALPPLTGEGGDERAAGPHPHGAGRAGPPHSHPTGGASRGELYPPAPLAGALRTLRALRPLHAHAGKRPRQMCRPCDQTTLPHFTDPDTSVM